MSNQQAPSRPWFRLASLARPAPTPTPEPTPAPPRPADTVPPAFRPPQSSPTAVSLVPTSPAAVGRASQPSSLSVPSNSPEKNVQTATPTTAAPTSSPPKTATTTSSMASSPTAVKPAMQSPIKSPKIKPPTAPTPSPLTLPPPQLKAQAEVEPKNKIPVEVQKTIDKPKEWLFGAPQKDVGEAFNPSIPLNEPYNNGETKKKGHGKDDVGTRVITIAGANEGAFMELIGSPHNNGFQGSPHRIGKMVDPSRTGSDYQIYSSSDGEGEGKMNNNSNRTSKTKPMNVFMNSNVQGVNNSIFYNSSCTHHDPGVHLSLQRKPAAGAGGFHVKERINGYNS